MLKTSKTSLAGYLQIAIIIMAAGAVFFTDMTIEQASLIALGLNQLLTTFGLFKAQDQVTVKTVNPDPQDTPPDEKPG